MRQIALGASSLSLLLRLVLVLAAARRSTLLRAGGRCGCGWRPRCHALMRRRLGCAASDVDRGLSAGGELRLCCLRSVHVQSAAVPASQAFVSCAAKPA